MSSYLSVIKQGFIFFPFVALLISIPFILIQYHKFGSISSMKAFLIYSFLLYIICAYFLVILPLPSIEYVKSLTTSKIQLQPFYFLSEMIKRSSFNILDIHTYSSLLREPCSYIPIYNIFLTLPFGIYLRYYFKCDLKQTILYSFLLSLFFEITQITGLYFIYPRGYRVFDVDDLILNTFGGLLGYLIFSPIIKRLPSMDEINNRAKEKGVKISGLRRSATFILDLFILLFFEYLISLFVKNIYCFILIAILYFIIIPIFTNGSTLGEKYLNIKIVDYDDKVNIIRIIFRRIIFILIYCILPYTLYHIFIKLNISNEHIKLYYIIFSMEFLFFIYSLSILKYMFTSRYMIYEKISKTKMISTINNNVEEK